VIRAAIFDFDETMVELEAQHGAASAALAAEQDSDYLLLPASFRHRSGHRVIDDVAEMKSFFGWTADLDTLYARRQELFHDECARAEITLLPGVERVVRRLSGAGLPLGIASSGSGESIRRILARLGLHEPFSVVVAGEDVTRGKPDPEPYTLAASRLGVRPDECLVFEDSALGVRSAKAAGCFVVAVRNPKAASPQDLDAADLVVAGMTQLSNSTLTVILGR
jgi:HAD superfamily hydrolase (TIGR01509 family)